MRLLVLIPLFVMTTALAQESLPLFTANVLTDPSYLAEGREVWHSQCRHCHGRSAYPGKAPHLKPSTYQPDWVYDRVTNGFRKMPAWRDIFTQRQRESVTVYIMSEEFQP